MEAGATDGVGMPERIIVVLKTKKKIAGIPYTKTTRLDSRHPKGGHKT